MLKEREEILDAMLAVDKKRHLKTSKGLRDWVTDAEFRIKKEVKNAVPSSKGLRDCLRSIDDRFPWSTFKYWFIISMSFMSSVMKISVVMVSLKF